MYSFTSGSWLLIIFQNNVQLSSWSFNFPLRTQKLEPHEASFTILKSQYIIMMLFLTAESYSVLVIFSKSLKIHSAKVPPVSRRNID